MNGLTSSQIWYLYIISILERPTITNVAKELGYSKPSVVNAFNNLRELGLIIYDKKDIRLTNSGLKYAKNYGARRESLIMFFTSILKIEKQQAVIDADRIMQIISCQTIVALNNYLANELGQEATNMRDVCLGDCTGKGQCEEK